MPLAGSLADDGLRTLLLAAAERTMYASVLIDGPASGVIHIVNGRIALVGSDDMKTMRVAQHELTTLLRDSIGATTGTYRCAPLTDIENATEIRSVGIQQVLTAVGAISTTAVDAVTAPPAPVAEAPTRTGTPTASPDPVSTPAPAAAPAPAVSLDAVRDSAGVERPIRASQLRKMLRVKQKATPQETNATVGRILDEPEEAVDRQAALRSIIRDLAS